MLQVKKRDGSVVPFDLSKITNAITRAFIAEHKPYTAEMIETLALKVTADFNNKVTDEVVSVESIQDSVENVLLMTGYTDVAKSYMVYRQRFCPHRKIYLQLPFQ